MNVTGYNIKRKRAKRRMSLRALGKASGCAKSYIWEIEKGKSNISEKKLAGIAEALGCTVAALYRTPRGEGAGAAPGTE